MRTAPHPNDTPSRKHPASAERYVRVYYRILEDPKFTDVYSDDVRFATWVRLLMAADNAWPHPAPTPRNVNADAFTFLVDVGLIDLATNDHYRVHGLDAERMHRREQGLAGGLVRAAGPRAGGRFTSVPPANADQRTVTSVSPASSSKSISKSIPTLDASTRTNGHVRTPGADGSGEPSDGVLPEPPGLPSKEEAGRILAEIRAGHALTALP
jgi:hypothetical protein